MGKFFSRKKFKAKYKQMFDSTISDYEDYIDKILKIEEKKGKKDEQELKEACDENGKIGKALKNFKEATSNLKNLNPDKFSDITLEDNLGLFIDKDGKCYVYYTQLDPEVINNFMLKADKLALALETFKCKSKNKEKLVHKAYDKCIKDTVNNSIDIFNTTVFQLKNCHYTAKKDMESPDKIKKYNGSSIWVCKPTCWTDYDKSDTAGYISTEDFQVFVVNKEGEITKGLPVKTAKGDHEKRVKGEGLLLNIGIKQQNNPRHFSITDSRLKML